MAHHDSQAAATDAADARQRALRAFAWGVATDVLISLVLLGQTVFVPDAEWSSGYWKAVGLLMAKTALQALVTAVGRRIMPPNDLHA